ncbi:MFS transporter [Burkholderia ubonensis]|uniref:MFS transporter n=1 Tax=Burkholderia ubonensis TaxID=101571 RepID=UPI0007566EEE|nr:hypothetical protein WJ87_19575 [Burkholderia ubonensis]KVQ37133.1 hypothetical protein WK00_13930 [Burkholderia ubonensis]KVQ95144.1 hypothetical protein WK09_09285 [Burkholderia ubonensis]KWB62075.1 hypothetical protein WL37_22800 [Burkholderia ubonensis]KWB91205.1 hypothetical protein WL43_05215 [Burkholderia ubonensis]
MPEVAAPPRPLSIALLAISAFVIVTTEFLIVGLLPALARELRISISTARQRVTLFAFTVMLFGPFLTAALSHVERKRLFIALMFVFAAANTHAIGWRGAFAGIAMLSLLMTALLAALCPPAARQPAHRGAAEHCMRRSPTASSIRSRKASTSRCGSAASSSFPACSRIGPSAGSA